MSSTAGVIYRLPGEKEIHSFSGIEKNGLTAGDLASGNYFVYAPFALTATFSGFKTNVSFDFSVQELKRYDGPGESYSKDEYISLVNETVERIQSGLFQKVVHSRFRFFECTVDTMKVFTALTEKFPNAFVYLLSSPTYGVWCGATPEILVTRNKNRASTMALAGTRKTTDNHLPWSDKDLQEQNVVSDLIREKLSANQYTFSEGKTYTRVSGGVSHICTEFEINLQPEDSAVAIAQMLHPTPAVCGFPTNEAFMRIYGVEKQTRQLYSGIIGQLGAGQIDNLFVNLRCMRVYANGLRMHAGGGINAASVGEKEWDETELKMKHVLEGIVNY